jgi:hypothetical protein
MVIGGVMKRVPVPESCKDDYKTQEYDEYLKLRMNIFFVINTEFTSIYGLFTD